MKQTILFLFMCFSIIIQGQNLVPNPSFEEYYTCPQNVVGLANNIGEPFIKDWYSMSLTPDYMHYCSGSSSFNYPTDNAWGYQEPFEGDGYVSLISINGVQNEREYIAVELSESLAIGQSYYLSFYASDADGGSIEYIDCASSHLGAMLMTNPSFYWIHESDNNPLTVGNEAHILYEEILNDSLGWIHIDGNFIADEAYTHVVLGNFFEDDNTLVQQTFDTGCESMQYIDNVCISTVPEGCNIPDGVLQSELYDFEIYPNPSENLIQLPNEMIDRILEVHIINEIGQIVFAEQIPKNGELKIENLSFGMYFLIVNFKSGFVNSYKFFKR